MSAQIIPFPVKHGIRHGCVDVEQAALGLIESIKCAVQAQGGTWKEPDSAKIKRIAEIFAEATPKVGHENDH